MSRVTLALAALCGVLIGALGTVLLAPADAPDPAQLRSVVAEVLAERDAATRETDTRIEPETVALADLDEEALHPVIEEYLLNNPRILERVSNALQEEIRVEEAAEARDAIASLQEEIFEDPGHVVLGNPEGDVTLVEMFDYNCSYCRSALPDLATLLAEDDNLRVILKEFPILSQQSVEAARVAVAVAQSDADYWDFHQELFTARGQITAETALDAAAEMGLSRVQLELDMNTPEVTSIIERSYDIAEELNISGTPTYIIGDEIIPGAIGVDGLRQRIANMRECGSTVCDS